jgi:hypothetical protein
MLGLFGRWQREHIRCIWNGRRGHIVCTFPPKLVGDVPPFLEWLQGYARDDMDYN